MVYSKIFSDLPELTSEIIQYFQNDFSTLHSCVLVNRLWCRLSIPLLWENPFLKKIVGNHHFINFYLSKLNEDDKLKLKEHGIIIPSSTLFNYSSFIKCLNNQYIYSSIFHYAKILNFYKDKKLLNFIYLSLIKIFIENEANLHTFEISQRYYINNETLFPLILEYPKFICNIKNLMINFGGLNNNNLLLLLKCFYLNCSSISSLDFNFYRKKHDDDISKVIESQKNLQKISFSYEHNSLLQIKSLELLLQKSGNYLENIGFESSIDYKLKLKLFKLAKIYCVNIKFLEMFGFDVLNVFLGIDLIKNVQQNLNYLSINCSENMHGQQTFDDKISSIILQNLGQKLLIGNKVYLNSEDFLACIKKYIMKEKRVSYLAMDNGPDGYGWEFKLKDEVEEFKSYGIQVMFHDNLYIRFHNLKNELLY
ncbi:hypothetical protein GLOIN_2v1774368 [Rhizophagus irregularis DAOM 181602=DAOM 197198]|nr:hypothetical protein GLOIN_2v1774368 [Rhizophagus irregularis DAOM 181602=DAOM 197198]